MEIVFALFLSSLFFSFGMGSTPGIFYSQNDRTFRIQGKQSTYAFQINDDGLLEHIHWGKEIGAQDNLSYLIKDSRPISFDPGNKNALMLEWSDFGTGDFRTPSAIFRYWNGTIISPMVYSTHVISKGKPIVDKSQPSLYVESENEATSLSIEMIDTMTKLKAVLWFTVYHNYDIISRRVSIINNGANNVVMEGINSATVDFPVGDYEFSHLSGSWARERSLVSQPLRLGTVSIESKRGASSHQHNPFVVISNGNYHESHGEHFAFNLVYSGNFKAEAEVIQTGRFRMNMGINPFNFQWKLTPGSSFHSPEVVLAYSSQGVGEISRQLHSIYRTRMVRGLWRDKRRPILVNSWEAMYFDVSEEKIINNLAKPASELGIELVVLDDGWFGNRNNDRSSLGDWSVNPTKFPNGLGFLANEINKMGLSFGIWMEPEMISRDSDLYRAHPDWCLHTGDRPQTESRNQLVLDLTREDVRNYVVNAVLNILSSANIEYLKWDFNRHLTEVSSDIYGTDQQGEIYHRFVLGVYDIMERITSRYPNVLFESCSGGGGRYDPAMLYYMPQVWASDNTDAISRAKIQYGTSIPYPASSMGAHVSVVPNHQTGRLTSMKTRSLMAFGGAFGYELDLLKLTVIESAEVKRFVSLHKQVEETVRTGEMYRLSSPFNSGVTSWSFVANQGNTVLVFAFNTDYYEQVWNYPRLKLQGLIPEAIYNVSELDNPFALKISGYTLMNAGLVLSFNSDAQSTMFTLERINE